MSFTTLATVKKHLLSSDAGVMSTENEPVTLSAETETNLPDQNITENSEVVKWDISTTPLREGPVALTGYEKLSLSANHLVKDSVVVTLDDTLSTVYVEESDYKLNYDDGFMFRVPGGHIPDNQPVLVYYNAYTLFDPVTDYEIDYARGTLRRRSGSTIPDGATLLVDYAVSAGSLTDELISQAIVEAEDLIIRSLSTDYSASSNDQGLQTGSTMLVLSVIARDLATEALARRLTADAAGRAKELQNLSSLFELRAWQTLRPYLDRYPVHGPERRPNG